jgi:hypothetical protein
MEEAMIAFWNEEESVLEGGQVEAFKFTRHRACLHALQFLWTTKKSFFLVLGFCSFFSLVLGFCSFFFGFGVCVAERLVHLIYVGEDKLV